MLSRLPLLAGALFAYTGFVTARAETNLDAIADQCRTRMAQCQCQSQEIIRRTPRATLDAIMAQPPSEARKLALIDAMLATVVRDHIAITRACGPVLHPENAPAS